MATSLQQSVTQQSIQLEEVAGVLRTLAANAGQGAVSDGESHRSHTTSKKPPLSEFPTYTGSGSEDLASWAFSIKERAAYHQQSPAEVVQIATQKLDGLARTWWRNQRARGKPMPHSIEELTDLLGSTFAPGDSMVRDATALLHCKQTGSVADFVNVFLARDMTYGAALPDSFKQAMFLEGLTADMKAKVQMGQPKSFNDAVDLALRMGQDIPAKTVSFAEVTRFTAAADPQGVAPMQLGAMPSTSRGGGSPGQRREAPRGRSPSPDRNKGKSRGGAGQWRGGVTTCFLCKAEGHTVDKCPVMHKLAKVLSGNGGV